MGRDSGESLTNTSIFNESGWKQDHQWRMQVDKQVLGSRREEKMRNRHLGEGESERRSIV